MQTWGRKFLAVAVFATLTIIFSGCRGGDGMPMDADITDDIDGDWCEPLDQCGMISEYCCWEDADGVPWCAGIVYAPGHSDDPEPMGPWTDDDWPSVEVAVYDLGTDPHGRCCWVHRPCHPLCASI